MSRALVISGGGSKGAYAVGVAQVLMREFDLEFDIVVGTSTGGLVAPFVAAAQLDYAESFYTSVTTRDIYQYRRTSAMLRSSSLATFRPLYLRLKEVADQIGGTVLSASTQTVLTATRLQDCQSVFFHTGSAPRNTGQLHFHRMKDTETLALAMLASASIPILAPPVPIEGQQYVDGGVIEKTPVTVPVTIGVDEVWVILLSPQVRVESSKQFNTLTSVFGRTIDALTGDVAAHDLDPIRQAAELRDLFVRAESAISAASTLSESEVRNHLFDAGGNLTKLAAVDFKIIGPSQALTDNSNVFKKAEMREMLEQGRQDARAALDGGDTRP